MNLYFLVEGRRTEKKVYPAWLELLVPKLQRVMDLNEVNTCNYFIFSGEGYPSLLDVHFENTIKDYNECGNFDRLVVCLDVDESTPAERRQVVIDKAIKCGFPTDQLVVITQNCCIETWFLGNRKAVSPTPNLTELNQFLEFYNVREDDPEMMEFPNNFTARSVFHSRFFQLVSQDKRLRYTKHYPKAVVDKAFLEELIARQHETNHLGTFSSFLSLCKEINAS